MKKIYGVRDTWSGNSYYFSSTDKRYNFTQGILQLAIKNKSSASELPIFVEEDELDSWGADGDYILFETELDPVFNEDDWE